MPDGLSLVLRQIGMSRLHLTEDICGGRTENFSEFQGSRLASAGWETPSQSYKMRQQRWLQRDYHQDKETRGLGGDVGSMKVARSGYSRL